MLSDHVFIIAEMSANHCGDLDLAKKIIAAAKDAGADAVKIQTYTADTITLNCHNPEFRISGGTLWDDKYLYDLYKEAYTPWEWQGVTIGLSDHSMSIVPPVTAVALGARVIEKHLTLDRALGGADAGFSLDVAEFAEMVRAVRATEAALGTPNYEVSAQNRRFARSLYVCKDVKKGERFTPENVRSVRPSNGLHPSLIVAFSASIFCGDVDIPVDVSADDRVA